jgi:hypothetical protein
LYLQPEIIQTDLIWIIAGGFEQFFGDPSLLPCMLPGWWLVVFSKEHIPKVFDKEYQYNKDNRKIEKIENGEVHGNVGCWISDVRC